MGMICVTLKGTKKFQAKKRGVRNMPKCFHYPVKVNY